MKPTILALALIASVHGCGGCGEDERKPVSHHEPRSPDQPPTEDWCRPVHGLRGRLVRQEQSAVGTTEIIGVALELENLTTGPLAVRNDPAAARLKLFDARGQEVPRSWLPRSGPIAEPKWIELRGGGTLRISLYDYGVGVPQGKGALLALLPYAGDWLLKPGRYTLRGTYSVQPRPDDKPPENAWQGELELPPLEIEIR